MKTAIALISAWLILLAGITYGQGVSSIGSGSPVFGTGTGGSGSGSGGLTNITTYTMTFTAGQTNPVDVYSSDFGRQVNGRYFWNTTIGRYTNNGSTNWLFKSADNGGQWVVGGYTNDPSLILNIFYYVGSTANLPLNESGAWLYTDGNSGPNAAVLIGTITATNNLVTLNHEGVTFYPDNPKTGSTAKLFSAYSLYGSLMYSVVGTYNDVVSFSAPYYYVEPFKSFVPNPFNNGTANDGLNAYAWNLASSYNTNADKRFSVGVSFLHGTNGQNGSTFELLNQTRKGYNPSTAWTAGGFNRAFLIGTKNDITVGDLPYSQHGTEFTYNGWFNIVGSQDTARAQLVLGTNATVVSPLNGSVFFDGRVKVTQNGVTFPIPQLNQTNVALSAATTFTWVFTYPYADTNYSVTVSGMGNPLVSPQIGTKTTTNVVISFTAFTGTLNAIAARQ